MEKVKIIVTGRVQGVGFRYMTKMAADKLHITGLVKNLDNGDVYIEAAGDKDVLKTFIGVVKASPSPSGRVDYTSIVYDTTLPDYQTFKIVG